jgi:hypothetical protein
VVAAVSVRQAIAAAALHPPALALGAAGDGSLIGHPLDRHAAGGVHLDGDPAFVDVEFVMQAGDAIRPGANHGPQAGMNVTTNEPEDDTTSRRSRSMLTIEIAPTRFPHLNTAS